MSDLGITAKDIKDIIGWFVTPIITIFIAWAFGHRLTAKWGDWQKRREQVRDAANGFYKLYGEFFAIWKLWNYSLGQKMNDEDLIERQWKLLERAAAAEASMETTMVKLASERILTDAEMAMLGRFRQAYQCLRQSIKRGKRLDWSYDKHPEYLAFKHLATGVSHLVSTEPGTSLPQS